MSDNSGIAVSETDEPVVRNRLLTEFELFAASGSNLITLGPLSA